MILTLLTGGCAVDDSASAADTSATSATTTAGPGSGGGAGVNADGSLAPPGGFGQSGSVLHGGGMSLGR